MLAEVRPITVWEDHLFRAPTPTGYQSQVILSEDAIVATLQFGVEIAVREILPKIQ